MNNESQTVRICQLLLRAALPFKLKVNKHDTLKENV